MINWATTAEFNKITLSKAHSRNWVETYGSTSSATNVFARTDINTSSFVSAETVISVSNDTEYYYTSNRVISELKTTSTFAYNATLMGVETVVVANTVTFVRGFYSDVVSISVTGTESSVIEETTSSEFENDPDDIFYTVSSMTSGTIFYTTVPASSVYKQTSTTQTFTANIGVTTETTTNVFLTSWNGANFFRNTIQSNSIRRFATIVQTTLTREVSTTIDETVYLNDGVVFDTIFKANTINNHNASAEVLLVLTGQYNNLIIPANQIALTATETTFYEQRQTKTLTVAASSLTGTDSFYVTANEPQWTGTRIDYTWTSGENKQVISANYNRFPPVETQSNILSRTTRTLSSPQNSFFNPALFVQYKQTQTSTAAFWSIGTWPVNAPDISYQSLFTSFGTFSATLTKENSLIQRTLFLTEDASISGSADLGELLGITISSSLSRTATYDNTAEVTQQKDIVRQKHRFGLTFLEAQLNTIRVPTITWFRPIGAKLGNTFGGAYTAAAFPFGTISNTAANHKALVDVVFDSPFPRNTSFLRSESTVNFTILENGYSYVIDGPNGETNDGFQNFNLIGETNTILFATRARYLGANGQESWVYFIPPNAYKVIKGEETFTTVYLEPYAVSGSGSFESSYFEPIPVVAHLTGIGPVFFPNQTYEITTTPANEWPVTSIAGILPPLN